MISPMVKIYSTPWCTYCKRAKTFFDQHGVKYEEVNVQGNPEAQKEMIAKSQQMGVPVIDVNGKIVVGFDRPQLAELLGLQVNQ